MRKSVKKYLYIVLGSLCVFLGLVGAFLPGLPTTPFALLAGYFFSRSSPRLHQWLLNLPKLGPAIRDWEEHRVIRPRAKILASIMIVAVFSSTALLVSLKPLFLGIHIALGITLLIFILSRRSSPKHSASATKVAVVLLCLLAAFPTHAMVELRADYSYSEQVFGIEEDDGLENSSVTETISGSFAWYLWNMTAIEFYGNRTQDILTDNDPVVVDSTFTIVSNQSVVTTQTFGIGIRQALWSKRYRVVPTISFGYAKQFIEGYTEYVISDSGNISRFKEMEDEEEISSGYIGFALRIRLSRRLGFTGSVRSVMPDFDTSKWSQNLYYTAGLSLIL